MTYRNKDLLHVIHKLKCVNCENWYSQAAHANLQEFGKGMGTKASDAAIMALCPVCHTSLDQGKDMSKQQRRDMQFECIAKTYVQLMEQGLIVVLK